MINWFTAFNDVQIRNTRRQTTSQLRSRALAHQKKTKKTLEVLKVKRCPKFIGADEMPAGAAAAAAGFWAEAAGLTVPELKIAWHVLLLKS